MQRDRLRSVLLVLQGRQTLEVTATVGRSRAVVQRVKASATPRDGVASLRGPQIQGSLDREFGKTFSINGVYQLLKRTDSCASSLQNGRKSIWGFAAVEPATGWSLAMPFRDVNTATLQAFLDAAASKLRRREHHWSNRTYADEQALVDEAVRSSRTLRRKDIRPICRPRWITPED